MSLAVDVVKRRGKRPTEPFAPDKLHRSIVAACLSARAPEGEADTTAHHVCHLVTIWLGNKPEVTSHDLRVEAAKHLTTFHPEAAYSYKHHRLVL